MKDDEIFPACFELNVCTCMESKFRERERKKNKTNNGLELIIKTSSRGRLCRYTAYHALIAVRGYVSNRILL